MKHLYARLLVIAALGVLLASTGCVYDRSNVVITEKVCVTIDEYQTTDNFTTFAVSDEFKEVLEQKLAEYNVGKQDVKSIHMVSGVYKVSNVQPHDWVVSTKIDIARQDDPNGDYDDGPAPFMKFKRQSLMALQGHPEDAEMYHAGVKLVNEALEALVDGEDPRLVMIVNHEDVVPPPSPSDPMQFTLKACVKFQFVIDMGHHGRR
jgi:hypothetical protein